MTRLENKKWQKLKNKITLHSVYLAYLNSTKEEVPIRITRVHPTTYRFEYCVKDSTSEKYIMDVTKPTWSRHLHKDVRIIKRLSFG